MSKETILKRCIVFVILSILFANPTWNATAQDCQVCPQGTPTSAGNVKRCTGEVPTIDVTYATGMDTVDYNHPVTLSATGGSPPYTWSLSGTGYTLSGTTTNNDLETLTLSCATGTCGVNYNVYTTVTVTDACGVVYTAQIRNTSGEWSSLHEQKYSTENAAICGWDAGHGTGCTESAYTLIIGAGKWIIGIYDTWYIWAPTQQSCPSCDWSSAVWETGSHHPPLSPYDSYHAYFTGTCCTDSIYITRMGYNYYEWVCQ